MSIIFGILAGIGVPIQTSINARLRKKVGSPYRASLVSFAVSLIFLVLLLLILGQGVHIPFDKMLQEPVWIYICYWKYFTVCKIGRNACGYIAGSGADSGGAGN